MIKAGTIDVLKLYAGQTKICSAYINGQEVFTGGCTQNYKWIPDPTSLICEQGESPDIEIISNLKSPFHIKLRNNGVDILLYDYFDQKVYRVNLDGLKNASDKRNYIYTSPSVDGTSTSNSVGGGMGYDSKLDKLFILPPMTQVVRTINVTAMSVVANINTPTLSSGVFSRSKPTLDSDDAKFVAAGNGGFVVIDTNTEQILPHSSNLPIGATPYSGMYGGNVILVKDFNLNLIGKYDLNTGATIQENSSVSLIGGSNRVFRGFYALGNKLYFTTVANGQTNMYLTIVNLDDLSSQNFPLNHLGQSASSIGGGTIAYTPVDGLINICGHINNQLAVWKFHTDGTYLSGYVNPAFTAVTDAVYNPSNNRLLATVRGSDSSDTDGAILYLS